ncbi:MAG TPA: AraC family transcriptional regulator [Steroidobacteraceae bacterium]|nr:AraC family transcriptional regulator [Steroidobacteraceae bacterium]
MSNLDPAKRYRARFLAVLDYVDAHLQNELRVAELSEIASFSKFHFHRQFQHLFGMSVNRYVQLSRLKRASYQLAFREEPVLEVAIGNGYESPESFARAFRKHTLRSPSDFRSQPDWTAWDKIFQPLSLMRHRHMDIALKPEHVEIIEFPATQIALLEHRGDPRHIGDSIRKLIAWRKEHRLHPSVSATFNLLYEDPEAVPAEQFRIGLAAATLDPVASNEYGVVACTIPAGRCARLRVVGSDTVWERALRHLYSEWLPGSSEEPRDFPLFLQRVAFYPDVPENEAITDIFLPLR